MTNFELLFTDEAYKQLNLLEKSKDKTGILKAVHKTLGLMETNLRHPSLNTHAFSSLAGPQGEKVFESYAQNNTPGAYRIFLALRAQPKTNNCHSNYSSSITMSYL